MTVACTRQTCIHLPIALQYKYVYGRPAIYKTQDTNVTVVYLGMFDWVGECNAECKEWADKCIFIMHVMFARPPRCYLTQTRSSKLVRMLKL